MAIACKSINQLGWLELREQLWPHHPKQKHVEDMCHALRFPERFAQFIEYDDSGAALGLAEVSLRTDYVNGTTTSPVAFLEGIYVVSQARRSGIARRLIAETERWALNVGCREWASDAPLENMDSHAMHAALGFSESECVVFFKKTLWS
jgi:aminoglycoside 6'-N-acetyltransferase I